MRGKQRPDWWEGGVRSQEMLAASGCWKRQAQILPGASRNSQPCWQLWHSFWNSNLHNCKRINVWCFKLLFMTIWYSIKRELRYPPWTIFLGPIHPTPILPCPHPIPMRPLPSFLSLKICLHFLAFSRNEIICYIPFFIWLLPVCFFILRFPHIVSICNTPLFHCLAGSHHVDIPQSAYPLSCWWTPGFLSDFDYANTAARNIWVQGLVWTNTLASVFKYLGAGWPNHMISMFNMLKKKQQPNHLPTWFYHVMFPSECKRGPTALHLHQHLVWPVFSLLPTLIGL